MLAGKQAGKEDTKSQVVVLSDTWFSGDGLGVFLLWLLIAMWKPNSGLTGFAVLHCSLCSHWSCFLFSFIFFFNFCHQCCSGFWWDDMGEWHWNMYNIICETNRQSRFDARYWMLGAGALRCPRGMGSGGRCEGASGWGTHVHLWLILVNVYQKPLQLL